MANHFEEFDDVWLIEYRHEEGGSRGNGSYSRIKNQAGNQADAGR